MLRNAICCVLLIGSQGIAAAQWEIENANTTSDLRGIHSVGGGVAWASGTNGTVLRTEDGGYVWQTCTIPPGAEKLDFRGIQAFDANTAIVMSSGKGDLSRLYKTTDGCHSWKLVFTNPDKDGFWDAIQLYDRPPASPKEGGGILIGDPVQGKFAIFRTSDRGSTWRRWGGLSTETDGGYRERPAGSKRGEALFAASNEALSFGDGNFFAFVTGGLSGAWLLYANDSGWCIELGGLCSLSFPHVRLPMQHPGPSTGAFAVASKDPYMHWPSQLMVVGGDYEHPDEAEVSAVLVSMRGGIHMPFTSYFDIAVPTTPPHGYRSAVAYDAATKTWITVGPNGTDISTDDGKNWRALKPDPARHEAPDADKNWNALSLPFVVGPKGRIGKLNPEALK